MCGITGFVNGKVLKNERDSYVQKMNDAIFHRGPDDDGWFSDELCSLAMRRLSIIDLKLGKQPIYSNDGSKLIFFNGEIYNFKELRKELEILGIIFKTNTDTECLVNLYQIFGVEMLKHLRGMFALCIYDLIEKKIFIARDRFGEKPLFYHVGNNGFIFSSELFSLLENPLIPRLLNKNVVSSYLNWGFVHEPNTLIQNVFSLEPGHYLIYENGILTTKQYFSRQYLINKEIKNIQDAVNLVQPVFRKAVESQTVSDVPIGAFLSGGIDSSSIVAQLQQKSIEPIKTFNVRFEEVSYDESPIAREVAKKIKTEHHELFVPNSGYSDELFNLLIRHIGVPFTDSSAIPSYFVCKEIRKHVKVALSGDGGDELFGGYSIFSWFLRIDNLNRIPIGVRNLVLGLINGTIKLPLFNKVEILRQIRKGVELSLFNKKEMAFELHKLFQNNEIENKIFVKSFTFQKKSYITDDLQLTPIRQIMDYRMEYNLPLDMLVKVDRMSMANSLEVRAPFLDFDLFEVASTIPDEFLRNKENGKLVLREMMKEVLPKSVFSHPKSGFSIPLHKYMNDEYFMLCENLFQNGRPIRRIIKKEYLDYLLNYAKNKKNGDARNSIYSISHKLWSVTMLAQWLELFKIEIE